MNPSPRSRGRHPRIMILMHKRAKRISLTLPQKQYPPQNRLRSAQQNMFFSCCVVESGYSTHLPHPERMRPKTRLPRSKSEQSQRKRSVKRRLHKLWYLTTNLRQCWGVCRYSTLHIWYSQRSNAHRKSSLPGNRPHHGPSPLHAAFTWCCPEMVGSTLLCKALCNF